MFVIAKYLSIEQYGYLQIFILFSTYVGILHFGVIDSFLVRWSGMNPEGIKNEFKTAIKFLFIEQCVVIFPLILIIFCILETPFRWISILVLIYAFVRNLETFFSFSGQAMKVFGLLTLVNASRAVFAVVFIVFLFAAGYSEYPYVALAIISSFVFALAMLFFSFRKHFTGSALHPLWGYGRKNIKTGIFILLGNFIMLLFFTIDRLMVNHFFSIEQFAVYAFAVIVVLAIYSFIQVVAQVFFPYLSGTTDQGLQFKLYQRGKAYIILAWAAILVLYFPTSALLAMLLPDYVVALPIMQILFCTIGFGCIIQVLHIGYYKLHNKQKHYFFWGGIALATSIGLNILGIKYLGTLEIVAIATLISFAIWYIINELVLKKTSGQTTKRFWRDLVLIIVFLLSFILVSLFSAWFVQMLVYLGLFSIITMLFLKSDVMRIANIALEMLRKKRG